MTNQENTKAHDETVWPTESDENELRLGNEFVDQVVMRARRQVAIRDYLYMCLQGFFDVFIGLLKGIPKSNPNPTKNEA